jgi:hypothetical protein
MVLPFILFFVFSLAERKNEKQKEDKVPLRTITSGHRVSPIINRRKVVPWHFAVFSILLGASLTIAGCFFPWSCQQVGERSWHCPTAIVLRYSVQADVISRLEIQDNVQGSALIILFLTVMTIFLAFFAPRFNRRSKIVAITSSAALVLLSTYQFIAALTARIQQSGAFAGLAILTLAIVCVGALMMLVAGAIDQRAIGQHLA